MMHGGTIVKEIKHRMHVKNYYQCEPWIIKIRDHDAMICPTESNIKWVYYRHHWFEVVIDELITSFRDSQGKLDERFDDAMREAIEKCINENHINFNEEEN